MKNNIGLWIDHRKAVIVTVTDGTEEIKQITSGMEKHVHFSSGGPDAGASEDVRERKFGNQLNDYYDEVITRLRDAEAIQIFGPGEAKGELEARLEHAGLKMGVVEVETADKMTDGQIAAKVRQRFEK